MCIYMRLSVYASICNYVRYFVIRGIPALRVSSRSGDHCAEGIPAPRESLHSWEPFIQAIPVLTACLCLEDSCT